MGEIPPRSDSSDKSQKCPEDGQDPGGRADHGSCRQDCQRAALGGATAAVSDVWSAPHGPGLNRHSVVHSHTEQIEAAAGPPSPDGTTPPRVLTDGNIAGATTLGDVAPTSRGMPPLRKIQRGHNAVPMPVP